jgi:hypothetical protein
MPAGSLCGHLPTIVIACKSDPGVPLAVEATKGNEIGSPFGVGLVEVTTQSHVGKHKMKLSFGWMLRAISRERSECSPMPWQRPYRLLMSFSSTSRPLFYAFRITRKEAQGSYGRSASISNSIRRRSGPHTGKRGVERVTRLAMDKR